MAPPPKTIELCHKRIAQLEKENEAMSEALHSMNNECAVILSEKDKAFQEKCRTCRRGLREHL